MIFRVQAGRTALDRSLAAAVSRLAHGSRPVSIRALAGDIGISQRRLVRLFEERVGLEPKMVARASTSFRCGNARAAIFYKTPAEPPR